MNSVRLLLLVAFVSYGTQYAESIKPLTLLKTLIAKHLTPSNEQTSIVEDGGQQYALYKCDIVYNGADVQCADQAVMPNGNPILIEQGQDGNVENAGGNIETDAGTESIVIQPGDAEKEYEKVYPQDPNTEWLMGNVNPVENWPEIHPVDDAKKKIALLKDKVIEKIHMIKAKFKTTKQPMKPVTEPYSQDSSFLFNDVVKSTTPVHYSTTPVQYSTAPVQYPSTPGQYSSTPVQYSTAGPTITVQHPTASPPPQENIDVKISLPGTSPINAKPVSPLHQIYYYPVPYPVQWTGNNNCPPPTRQAYYHPHGYAPNAMFTYNARPATIENTPYPNQKLPYGFSYGGDSYQPPRYAARPEQSVSWMRYPYEVPKIAYYPNVVPALPKQLLPPGTPTVSDGATYPTSTAQPIAVYPADAGPSSSADQNENKLRNLDHYSQPEEEERPAFDSNVDAISAYPSRGDIAYESPKERRQVESENIKPTPAETTQSKSIGNVVTAVEEKPIRSTP